VGWFRQQPYLTFPLMALAQGVDRYSSRWLVAQSWQEYKRKQEYAGEK